MSVPARAAAITLLVCTAPAAWSEGQFVDLYPKTKEDLVTILDTLEASIADGPATGAQPIVVMLHGKEAHRYIRGNYQANKAIVDQTAKLAAYEVIDVKICETWMRHNDYDEGDLFPFVGTVPYGAGELQRLEREEGYVEFSVDL